MAVQVLQKDDRRPVALPGCGHPRLASPASPPSSWRVSCPRSRAPRHNPRPIAKTAEVVRRRSWAERVRTGAFSSRDSISNNELTSALTRFNLSSTAIGSTCAITSSTSHHAEVSSPLQIKHRSVRDSPGDRNIGLAQSQERGLAWRSGPRGSFPRRSKGTQPSRVTGALHRVRTDFSRLRKRSNMLGKLLKVKFHFSKPMNHGCHAARAVLGLPSPGFIQYNS